MTRRRRPKPPRPLPGPGVAALLVSLALVVGGCVQTGAGGAVSDLPVGSVARQASQDLEGPLILNVRASPPVAPPGQIVSLGATITDPSGVQATWVRIEGPDLDLNVTLVAFGDTWFLNRSWETQGAYRFEIGAQDGAGNVNTADGSFRIQDSLAGTFGLVLLVGALFAVGGAGLAYLWIRRTRRSVEARLLVSAPGIAWE